MAAVVMLRCMFMNGLVMRRLNIWFKDWLVYVSLVDSLMHTDWFVVDRAVLHNRVMILSIRVSVMFIFVVLNSFMS